MAKMTLEYDLTCASGVGVVLLKLNGKFLYVIFMRARHESDTWYGEVGYATAKNCRQMAEHLKDWIMVTPVNPDNRPVPFKMELPVHRYGEVFRDGAHGELDIEVNTDSDSVTVFVETFGDATYLHDTLCEMANRMDGILPWR